MLDPEPDAAADPAALDAALERRHRRALRRAGRPRRHRGRFVGRQLPRARRAAAAGRRRAGRGSRPRAARRRGAAVRRRGDRPAAPVARGYAVEPEAIAAAMTPRTRLVVLTRPHNPTGAVIDGPTLEAIADDRRARAHPCAGRRSLPGHARRRVAVAGGARERALHLDVEPDQGLRAGRPALRLGAGRARRRRPDARGAGRRRAGAGAVAAPRAAGVRRSRRCSPRARRHHRQQPHPRGADVRRP